MGISAVILAGGFGSRLSPLTSQICKPMLPVAARPMLDYCVANLASAKINDFVLTLGYKAEQVIDFVAGYSEGNFVTEIENEPLGTCGGVRKVLDKLTDTFVVVSGDCITECDIGELINHHFASNADITIATSTTNQPWLYGVLSTDTSGRVKQFIEKPPRGFEVGNLINSGIYVINKSAMSSVPVGAKFDFARDLFPYLLTSGARISTFPIGGFWCDLGDIASYIKTNFFIKDKQLNNCKFINNISLDDIILSGDSVIKSHTNSTNFRNSIIGEHCNCGDYIVENSILLDETIIKQNCSNAVVSNYFALDIAEFLDLASLRPKNQTFDKNIYQNA